MRDPVDTRMIGHLTSLGTLGNARVPKEADVGGQPPMIVVTRPDDFDSDNDGIPNAWETAHGLNPNLATDAKLLNPIGYTYIEQYINEIAINHAATDLEQQRRRLGRARKVDNRHAFVRRYRLTSWAAAQAQAAWSRSRRTTPHVFPCISGATAVATAEKVPH